MPIKINKKKLAKKMQEPVFNGIYCGEEACPYYNGMYDQECRFFNENAIFDEENFRFIRCLDCMESFEEVKNEN